MNEMTRISHEHVASELLAFTVEEYEQMNAEGAFGDMRVELVEGVLERMAAADPDHSFANARFGAALHDAYAKSEFRGAIDLIVRIDQFTARAPDISIVRPDPPRDRGVPSEFILLAVEITDKSVTRDLVAKPSDYARGGIPHYWAIDINKRVAHVFGRPVDGVYTERTLIEFGNSLTAPEVGTPIPLD